MGITVKKPDRSDFVPAPAGLHRAVCVDVIDMGLIDTGKFGVQDVVRLVWQTEAMGADGKRYAIHKRYNKTLGAKANLRTSPQKSSRGSISKNSWEPTVSSTWCTTRRKSMVT